MFDANARYIRKGVKFFACGYVDDKSELRKLGLESGQPVLCKMMDNTTDKPRVSIKINGKVQVVKLKWPDYSFLVYQGTPSGSGFICDKSKKACEALIGGFNNEYWKRRKELFK
jgi:hypothetical protein